MIESAGFMAPQTRSPRPGCASTTPSPRRPRHPLLHRDWHRWCDAGSRRIQRHRRLAHDRAAAGGNSSERSAALATPRPTTSRKPDSCHERERKCQSWRDDLPDSSGVGIQRRRRDRVDALDARAPDALPYSCARLRTSCRPSDCRQEVFGVSERDLIPANELIVVAGNRRRGDRRISARRS